MKQTALEWLIEEYFGGMENCTPDFRYHIEQAKEMEKEQIIRTHLMARCYENENSFNEAEQYYNETFKSE